MSTLERVALGLTGIESTRLGFGCAPLLGGRTTNEAIQLLEAAYDAGIRHFDVARVYGTGDAERVVGRFAKGRDDIVIATKFGIEPLAPSVGVTAAKRAARFAGRRSRRVVGFVRRFAPRTARRGRFDPQSARESIEHSLREVARDRLDLLMLHDCTAEEWATPGLSELLASFQDRGVIGAFGPASGSNHVIQIMGTDDPSVVQCESGGVEEVVDLSRAKSVDVGVVSFQPFADLGRLRSTLAAQENRERLAAAAGVDATDEPTIGCFLLAEALRANPGGVVLFAASTPERIRLNVRVALDPPPADQVRAFSRCAAALLSA